MAQNAPRGGWRIAALLWVAAAGYFLVGIGIGIEGVDEGHLVYLSWRVAEGALPYRDFQHWYGPATFFLNGALFRLFGPDLFVVRLALVVARATLAVEVFLISRTLAGTVPALLAWALTVAICGMPLWFFVTPYASNYQLPLALGALACLLLIDRRPVGAVLAGALLGLATTFKPLGGILPLAGCVLALLARGAPAASAMPPRTPAWRTAALTAVLGVGGILAAIAPSLGGAWNVALLWSPSVAVALWTLTRVWREPASAAAFNVIDVLWLGLGFAVVPLALVIFYAAHGLVSAMAWAVLLGLPRKFSLAASYPSPSVAAVLCLVIGAASVAIWRAERAGRRLAGVRAWVPAFLAAAAAAVLPISASLSTGGWLLASGELLWWLPPVAVWLAVAALMRGRRGDLPVPVRVVAIVSSMLLPLLGPVGDWAHILIALPVFLPLAAWGLCAVGASGQGVWRPWGYAVGAIGMMITGTLVHMLVASHPPLSMTGTYDRASAIQDRRPDAGDTHAVVAYVRDHVAPDARIAVMPSEAMLYFLSGRDSALDEDEFAFYAATTGPQLSVTDARQLVDEAAAIRRLEQERPIVIRRRGRLVATFREIFPTLGEYLERAYRPVMAFGPYQILESRAVGSRADGAEAEPR